MDAAVLTQPPAPQFGSFDPPTAAAGKLVLQVNAAALNPVDLAIAGGRFPGITPRFPSVAGHEGVGTVGGRRVYFSGPIPPYGAMAQWTLVAEDRVMDVPSELDDGTAAALGTAGMAAWLSLTHRAQLRPGETVLVLGATGALGSLAVQAARILGAGRVVAAGRDAEGLRRVAELGADATVDLGRTDDLATAYLDAAGGAVDVVIDPLWGTPARAALQAGAPFTRHIQIGNSASSTMELPAAAIRQRSAAILGYTNLMVPPSERAAAYASLTGHAIAGRITVDVEQIPLRDVEVAWKRQADHPHRKLILVP